MLELQVLMLNINDGNNEELKESCQVLKEYMQYVNCVRKYVYQEKISLNDAVEYAITECIKKGILEDFLRENRAEVVAMSIFEFDEEKELKLIREDEYEYGFENGYEEGRKEGQRRQLIEGICKKLRKGKDIEIIAEELDENISIVEKIYEIAQNFAPEYDVEKIMKMVQKK